MQHSSSEANICAHDDAQACCRTTRYFGACDRMLVGLAILTIVRASEALAGEHVAPTVGAAKPEFCGITAWRGVVPMEHLLFGSDFPHPEGLRDPLSYIDHLDGLSDDDVRLLDAASDPGIPYPKWMVLQLDTAEDPRSKILHPERYAQGGPWKDLRGTRWSS